MREEVKAHLEQLRSEVESLPAAESVTLRALIEKLEQDFAKESAGVDTGALGVLRGQIEAFEVEHPKMTSILNDLLIKLESMGI